MCCHSHAIPHVLTMSSNRQKAQFRLEKFTGIFVGLLDFANASFSMIEYPEPV
jgi:hypothetical protein